MLELKEGVRHPVDFILNGKPARGSPNRACC